MKLSISPYSDWSTRPTLTGWTPEMAAYLTGLRTGTKMTTFSLALGQGSQGLAVSSVEGAEGRRQV